MLWGVIMRGGSSQRAEVSFLEKGSLWPGGAQWGEWGGKLPPPPLYGPPPIRDFGGSNGQEPVPFREGGGIKKNDLELSRQQNSVGMGKGLEGGQGFL